MKLLLLLSLSLSLFAGQLERVVIKTNAVCEMCQVRIESNLRKLEGVKKVRLDLTTKNLTVKYDSEVLDVATIRQAVAGLGYNADDVPARPKVQTALPDCCKPDGVCTSDEKAKGSGK